MHRKRLKNVYDLLETGNNKKVVQEVDKLISVSTSSSSSKQSAAKVISNADAADEDDKLSVQGIARALKSLALVRMGRQDESEHIVEELLNANTKDENTLNILMQYCKETQQLGKIVLFYENAVKNSGGKFDEEMVLSLFYAYVRNRDYAKQQQCAIRLYKETSKRVYLYWNAMSYFLMHKFQPPPASDSNKPNNTMNLMLAEKLLEKQFKEKKMENGGEFQLYLLILETRGDLRAALGILDQSSGDNLNLDARLGTHNYTLEKRIKYLRSLGEWNEVRELCESKLDDALLVDNWTLYLAYIDSLDLSTPKLDDSEIDRVIEKFNSIQTKRPGEKIQGPYLAKIELSTRRKLADKSKQYLREYFEAFASKPGFYYDIEHFAPAIRELKLADYLLNEVLKPMYEANKPSESSSSSSFASIKSIYTCLSYFQFKRAYTAANEEDDQEKEAELLERMYACALDSFGRDLLATAYQYADEFLILAVYARLDAARKKTTAKDHDALILRLIANLRLGLAHSPASHQLKLLLINLYSRLGAFDALNGTYESMEIKNIQNYSISYLTFTQNMRLAAASTATAASTTGAYQFFTANLFDLANFLVNCFKYGTFVKIVEFIEFSDAVRESFAFALCCAVHASASVLVATEFTEPSSSSSSLSSVQGGGDDEMRAYLTHIGAKLNKFVRENASSARAFSLELLLSGREKLGLVDRNDKRILYEWESVERTAQIDADYKELLDEQQQLIKLRFLMVHYLTDVINLLNQSSESSNLSKIESCVSEFCRTVAASKLKLVEDKPVNPFGPCSSYLSRLNDLGLLRLVNLFVRLGVNMIGSRTFMDDESTRNNNKNLAAAKSELGEIFASVRKHVEAKLAEFDATSSLTSSLPALMESVSGALECVSFCLIVFVACVNAAHVQPTWAERMKKSKKKKEAFAKYAATIELVRDIHELLTCLVAYFVSTLKDKLTSAYLTSKCEAVFASVEPTFGAIRPNDREEKNAAARFGSITGSYVKSCEDMRKSFVGKLKILLKLAAISTDWVEYVDNAKTKFQ